MDERGNVSRDIRLERKANVGESRENAGRVRWKGYRILAGGMTVWITRRVKSPQEK
jgi:hypothetical protein